VYKLLMATGVTQKRIADLVRQRETEVSRIVNGGPVLSYDLLVRIADGFGIPRGWMGLAHDDTSFQYIPAGQEDPLRRPTFEEVDEDVKRRVLLAAATMAIADRPVLGPVVALDHAPVGTPLPSRIGLADVAALHALTEQYRALGRAGYGVPDVLTSVAHRAERRLLPVSADDAVKQVLLSQLVDLHTLAGWWCTDMLQVDNARYHYSRALKFAGAIGDGLGMVSAAIHAAAGHVMDAPNDALKLYQLVEAKLMEVPADHPRRAYYEVLRLGFSANCLAVMGRQDHANDQLIRADDLPPVKDDYERAEVDYIRARTRLAQGLRAVEGAAYLADQSVKTWPEGDRRDSALARITLATTHVIMGDRRAGTLTTAALDAVDGLRSPRNRAMLAPLEQALAARKDSASVELARRARTVRMT